MDDYIKREDAKELCFKLAFSRYENVIDGLNSIPSADVVEVVRCKNCKHWQENTEFCSKFSTLSVTHIMPPWAFCCLGERKEQGDE